jgi:hypothetical protein
MQKCRFNCQKICYAGICYNPRKCSAKDKKGNPVYATKDDPEYSSNRKMK